MEKYEAERKARKAQSDADNAAWEQKRVKQMEKYEAELKAATREAAAKEATDQHNAALRPTILLTMICFESA
jgi:hypothetical protein